MSNQPISPDKKLSNTVTQLLEILTSDNISDEDEYFGDIVPIKKALTQYVHYIDIMDNNWLFGDNTFNEINNHLHNVYVNLKHINDFEKYHFEQKGKNQNATKKSTAIGINSNIKHSWRLLITDYSSVVSYMVLSNANEIKQLDNASNITKEIEDLRKTSKKYKIELEKSRKSLVLDDFKSSAKNGLIKKWVMVLAMATTITAYMWVIIGVIGWGFDIGSIMQKTFASAITFFIIKFFIGEYKTGDSDHREYTHRISCLATAMAQLPTIKDGQEKEHLLQIINEMVFSPLPNNNNTENSNNHIEISPKLTQ